MKSANGRLVVQAWLGTRLVILLVALYLAVTEGRKLPDMFDNWDVPFPDHRRSRLCGQ